MTYIPEDFFEDDDSDLPQKWKAESQFFQKVDRLLSTDIRVKLKNFDSAGQPGPSCIQQETHTINIDFEKISTLNNDNYGETILTAKGLNYHELAHHLFTEINFNDFYKYVHARDVSINWRETATILNVLEDHRIENLFVVKYPSATKYFLLIASRVIYKYIEKSDTSKTAMINAYLLLYGRKNWLPVKLIAKCRNNIVKDVNEVFVRDLEFEIDNYMAGKNLDQLYQHGYNVLQLLKQQIPSVDSIKSTHSSKSIKEYGQGYKDQKEFEEKMQKPFSQDEQDAAKKAEQKNEIRKEAIQKEVKKEEENNEESANKSTESSDDSQQISKDKSENDESEEDTEIEGDEKESDSSSNNFSKSGGDSKENLFDQLKDLAEKLLNEDNSDSLVNKMKENLQEEVAKDIENIKEMQDDYESVRVNKTDFKFGEEEQKVINKLVRMFEKLKTGLSNRYVADKSGRFDMRRVMKTQKQPSIKIFKKYQQSLLDKAKIGVAVLVDSSSSVSYIDFNTEIKATYVLSQIVEKIGSQSMVIEFSDSHRIVKPMFSKKGSWGRRFCSRTYPLTGLQSAYKNLKLLKTKDDFEHLFVFIVTDGHFQYGREEDELIAKMNKFGIHTTLVTIGTGTYMYYDNELKNNHNCQEAINIRTFNQLETKLVDWIKKTEKRIIGNIKQKYGIQNVE